MWHLCGLWGTSSSSPIPDPVSIDTEERAPKTTSTTSSSFSNWWNSGLGDQKNLEDY